MAEIQHNHMRADVHYHVHVMLHQKDCRAEFLLHIEDETRHIAGFFPVHASNGFVEQKHLWLHRKSPAQLHPFLQTIGQHGDRKFADVVDLEKIDHPLFDLFAIGDLLALGGAEIAQG